MKTQLQNILPLKLRSPKQGEQELVQNEQAYEFWIGHILGDAYISESKGYMQVDQASENLAKWFHKQLASYNMLPAKSVVQTTERVDKRYNTTNTSYRFTTRAYNLVDWNATFYTKTLKKRNKTVPLNITNLLISPLSLAIWFLGDGWFDGDNVCFAAGTWDIPTCERLQTCLSTNFNLKTSLVLLNSAKNNGRTVHRITVSAESYNNFKQLVKPYIDDLEAFCGGPGSLKQDQFLKRKYLP